jgi:hypothetical protein
MYVETVNKDGTGRDRFNIVRFIKKAALKDSAMHFSQGDASKILIKVAWEREESGGYDAGIAAMMNGGAISLFSESATELFFKQMNGYKEKPLIDSIKNTKVDACILSALNTLKNSIKLLEYKVEAIKVAAKAAIKDANSSQGAEAAACNICVRSAVWHAAISSVLFPNHGAFIGNQQSSYLYGRISELDYRGNIGTANSMAASLAKSGVVPEFVAIPNMSGNVIPDFKQLQKWANGGQFIIGVLKGDGQSGHVVMIAPHSADLENTNNYDYRTISKSDNTLYLMPKILECGKGRRYEVYTLQAGVAKEKIKNMKWYRMLGTYTSPKNNVK